jgi:hypothetical protein
MKCVLRSKNKPLSRQQRAAYEATRNIAADPVTSISRMKAGRTSVVHAPTAKGQREWEAAWSLEADRREAQIAAGTSRWLPGEEVLERLRRIK